MAEEQETQENDNVSKEDLEKLNEDINKTQKELVSEETEQKLQQAKEEAKKEAEKEFATNQKIQELEKQKQEIEEKMKKKEEETASKLNEFKTKLDNAISSKAVVSDQNPFNKENSSKNIDKMSDEEINNIEQASYKAFESRKFSTEE